MVRSGALVEWQQAESVYIGDGLLITVVIGYLGGYEIFEPVDLLGAKGAVLSSHDAWIELPLGQRAVAARILVIR